MDPRRLLALAADGEEGPSTMTPSLSIHKMASYNAQAPRKSKHEKEKEAAVKKAKEEEEEAARAYEDFVAAFDVEEGAQKTKGKGFVRAGGEGKYNPLTEREESAVKAPTGPNQSNAKASYTRNAPPTGPKALLLDDDLPTGPQSKSATGGGRKKRDMDNFLEELKSQQREREDRLRHHVGRGGSSLTALAARENAPVLTGSFDYGDSLTTNIHVAGLPPTVTEQSLGMLFAKWGPVGSVKIMWPRVDGSSIHRSSLGGFVALLRRDDAEVAAKECDGLEWGGSVLRISWGKAVPLPSRAIFEIEGAGAVGRRNDRSHSPPSSSRRRRRSSSPPHGGRDRDKDRGEREWPELEQEADEQLLRTVAGKVREYGNEFEDVVRKRESENPRFAFLRNNELPSYHFFKMLLDRDYYPPARKVLFDDEGPMDAYSSDSAEDSENEHTRRGRLGHRATERFETILRGLTSTREKIARGMAFALEHADAANTVVDLLMASLTLPATPVPRKIARLHLVSDILHNSASSVTNAWVYRATCEARLAEVFDHLGEIFLSFSGRMKAEQFRMQVITIVDVWEHDWMIFEKAVIEDFKRRLSGETEEIARSPPPAEVVSTPLHRHDLTAPSPPAVANPKPSGFKVGAFSSAGFKTASFAPATTTVVEEEDVDGEEVDFDVDGVDVDREDVDGEGLDGDEVDVDGEEVADEDGAPSSLQPPEEEESMDLAQSDDDMF